MNLFYLIEIFLYTAACLIGFMIISFLMSFPMPVWAVPFCIVIAYLTVIIDRMEKK